MTGKKRMDKQLLESMCVSSDAPIAETLKRMDETGRKIVFVVDAEQHLAGVASDGDIRRWILSGGGLDRPVSAAMNAQPITLPTGYAASEAKELLVGHEIECIPILDAANRLTSAIWWTDLFEEESLAPEPIDAAVVIMAGGQGARLAPFTKVLPKPLIPIGETPILELIIERFLAHGCKQYFLTINYKSNLIKAYFSDISLDCELEYIEEDEPMGTAGALSMLKDRLHSAFFVSNCDILVEADYADILRFHREHENRVTLVASMKKFTVPYGVCEIREGGHLVEIREKPDYNHLVSTGLYVLEPDIIDYVPKSFYHMTDLVGTCIDEGERVGVYPVSEKAWFDMGQWEEYQTMLARFGLQ